MSSRVAYRRVLGLIAQGLCKIPSKFAVWYRGILLIRHSPPPRTTIGTQVQPYCRVLGGGCFVRARYPCRVRQSQEYPPVCFSADGAVQGLGFGVGVQGLGFRVQSLGFRVQGSGLGSRVRGYSFSPKSMRFRTPKYSISVAFEGMDLVKGLVFGVWGWGLGFRVQVSGFRVQG